MTPEPAPAPASREPGRGPTEDAGQGGSEQGEPRQGERYGPISVSRYVKDDGRALLLYARSAEESA